MRRALLVGLCVVMTAGAACGGSDQRVVVAAGTTLVDSGLLDALVEEFEAQHPSIRLSVVGDATAQVIELGRNRAADLMLTHSPEAEDAFIADGLSVDDAIVFESRFLLLGPASQVAELAGLEPIAAFGAIAGRGATFTSRADGSGTYARELEIWALAGIDSRAAPWLVETGQGMGLTLQVADQRDAFVLAEQGSYLAARPNLSLVPAALAPSQLLANPYRAIVVAGDKQAPASEFFTWLTSADGTAALLAANRELFGSVIFAPAR